MDGFHRAGIKVPAPNASGLPLVDLATLGDFCCHFWAEVHLKDWGWIPVEPQDPGAPLGQVPRNARNYVPFLRLPPDYDYLRSDAGIAVSNVQAMNCWLPRLEEAVRKPARKK